MRRVVLCLLVAATLASCGRVGRSRLNPFNLFRPSQPATLEPAKGYADVRPDRRLLVDQVVGLDVAARPGGVIVEATGLPPTQGWYDAALVAENDGRPVDGVLAFRFVVSPPPADRPVSTQASREVTAAAYVPDVRLDGVRQITVGGLRSARSSRR